MSKTDELRKVLKQDWGHGLYGLGLQEVSALLNAALAEARGLGQLDTVDAISQWAEDDQPEVDPSAENDPEQVPQWGVGFVERLVKEAREEGRREGRLEGGATTEAEAQGQARLRDEFRREAFEEAAEVKFGVKVPSAEEQQRMRPQDWTDLGIAAYRDAVRELAGMSRSEDPPLSKSAGETLRALAGQPPAFNDLEGAARNYKRLTPTTLHEGLRGATQRDWPFPWPEPGGNIYEDLGPKEPVTFTLKGHEFKVSPANQMAIPSGRERYRVECLSCVQVLHEATTGPDSRCRDHLEGRRDAGREGDGA